MSAGSGSRPTTSPRPPPRRDVMLTRARKQDGQPTVPSRWLSRLETLLG